MAILSSHTLDGSDGTHAAGVRVRLANLATGVLLFETETDNAGRLSVTLDLSSADPGDCYELSFATGSYWSSRVMSRAAGSPVPGSHGAPDAAPVMQEIVLRFVMPDPDARYHMPLILSPSASSCWWSKPE